MPSNKLKETKIAIVPSIGHNSDNASNVNILRDSVLESIKSAIDGYADVVLKLEDKIRDLEEQAETKRFGMQNNIALNVYRFSVEASKQNENLDVGQKKIELDFESLVKVFWEPVAKGAKLNRGSGQFKVVSRGIKQGVIAIRSPKLAKMAVDKNGDMTGQIKAQSKLHLDPSFVSSVNTETGKENKVKVPNNSEDLTTVSSAKIDTLFKNLYPKDFDKDKRTPRTPTLNDQKVDDSSVVQTLNDLASKLLGRTGNGKPMANINNLSKTEKQILLACTTVASAMISCKFDAWVVKEALDNHGKIETNKVA